GTRQHIKFECPLTEGNSDGTATQLPFSVADQSEKSRGKVANHCFTGCTLRRRNGHTNMSGITLRNDPAEVVDVLVVKERNHFVEPSALDRLLQCKVLVPSCTLEAWDQAGKTVEA